MDGVIRSDVKVVESPRRVKLYDVLLRFLGLAFTLAAAILVGASKETKTVPISLADNSPPLHLTFTAKWQYMSAFV